MNIDDYIASIEKLSDLLDEYDYLCSGHNNPWIKVKLFLGLARNSRQYLRAKANFLSIKVCGYASSYSNGNVISFIQTGKPR